MKASITNTLLKALPGGPVDIYDTKLPGFVLRVRESGRASYRVRYTSGKWVTLGKSTDLTPAEAREQAKKVLGAAASGADPQQERKRQKAATFRQYLTTIYEPWLITNRKDGKATAARIRSCFDKEMGGKRLHEINAWLVEKWRSKRLKDGIKPTTINRDMNALKAALNRASEWGYLDENPLAKVKPAKTDNRAKVRFLSADEATRLRQAITEREDEAKAERQNANKWRESRNYPLMPDLNALPCVDHIKPLVLLALNTGMRRGELFNLEWQDVDTQKATITVKGDGAKSGQTRHISLNAEALQLLSDWQATTGATTGLVFPGRQGARLDNINKAWKGLLARAGVTQFRFHDLRHTFASWLVMGGTDLYTVRDLLGHASIAMTERYAHLAPEHKAAAVASLRAPESIKEGQA